MPDNEEPKAPAAWRYYESSRQSARRFKRAAKDGAVQTLRDFLCVFDSARSIWSL